MMAKEQPEFGDLNAELDEISARPNLKSLRPRSGVSDAEVEANSFSLGSQYGASTSLPAMVSPFVSFHVEIPDYLDAAIKKRAQEQGVTKAFVMLQLCRAGMFEVRDVDMIADGRKGKPSRRRGR